MQHAEAEVNDVQKIRLYLRNLMEHQDELLMMLFLYLAGYFIFRSMFQIAAVTDMEYYGRLKTLGMSPAQIRSVCNRKRDALMRGRCVSGNRLCSFLWKDGSDSYRMECISGAASSPCLAAFVPDGASVSCCAKMQQKSSGHH